MNDFYKWIFQSKISSHFGNFDGSFLTTLGTKTHFLGVFNIFFKLGKLFRLFASQNWRSPFGFRKALRNRFAKSHHNHPAREVDDAISTNQYLSLPGWTLNFFTKRLLCRRLLSFWCSARFNRKKCLCQRGETCRLDSYIFG